MTVLSFTFEISRESRRSHDAVPGFKRPTSGPVPFAAALRRSKVIPVNE